MIALKLPIYNAKAPTMRRNFSLKNKTNFTQKLISADRTHLYELKQVDAVFNHFITKKNFKRIYKKVFTFVSIIVKDHIKPWLSKGLNKSINTKNKLYFQSKLDKNVKTIFIRYRHKLTAVIRAAKQQYYKNILNSAKTNSAKLWTHLNFLL